MPAYVVTESITVNAPTEEIHPFLHDFHHWPTWSPWHILDNSNAFKVSADGSEYSWESKLLGAGKMNRTSSSEFSIASDLVFLKPFKTQSKILFNLEPNGSQTKVVWEMHGKMPFFLFFMINSMKKFIGMDFQRGLKLLKDLVETGNRNCSIQEIGQKSIPEITYLYKKISCNFEDMGDKSKEAFTWLMGEVRSKNIDLTGSPFSIYHTWDMKNSRVDFSVCVPVRKDLFVPTTTLNKATLNAFSGFSMEMTGPYHHLGNLWAAQMVRQRNKFYKINKAIAPLEIYHNSPVDTPAEQLKSEVIFGMK